MNLMERLERETAGLTLPELEELLTRKKAEARKFHENGVIADAAGTWATEILHESKPNADLISRVGYHESGHFITMQALGLPVVAISMRLFANGDVRGLTHPTWRTINDDDTPGPSDAQNAGQRLRVCEDAEMPLNFDELLRRSGEIVRGEWARIQRIGNHVTSCCYSQTRAEWKLILSAEAIERLFWSPMEWAERYGEGILCTD